MLDVLIAGAGPAGSIAAVVLARAGARVLMVDRETFPRDKLCGDTLNPGAVRFLASLQLTGGALDGARPLAGMRLTGPHASVSTTYGHSSAGLAIRRRELDAWLLEEALRAGARFEAGLVARSALVEERAGVSWVRGLVLSKTGSGEELRLPAIFTVAADGRRSSIGRSLGLVEDRSAPRRWAYGVYASGVSGMSDLGEMHVRPGWYVGLSPITDTLTNICVVRTPGDDHAPPIDIVRKAIARDPALQARCAQAEFDADVRVLGPLANDVRSYGVPGLLLAGDASGFVDPMTGDGLHLAIQSAALAAKETLATLASGDFVGAPDRLARSRQATLGPKLRFNRVVRRLVDSSAAIGVAEVGARVLPGLLRRVVRYAGDVA